LRLKAARLILIKEAGTKTTNGNFWESGPNLSSLLTVLLMFLTSLSAIALGIFAAYWSVLGILYALAYQSSQRGDRALVLVPSEGHAGGD
jgi:hypothetical protein